MLRRILIVFGYLFLTLLVVGLTVVLVAYGNDYTYDFSTHKIIQKGHIIIDSIPNGIEVTADGKYLGKKTPYQAAYTVGHHDFSLNLTGYYSWQKSAPVIAGQVTLMQYVILVPKHPVRTVLDSRVQIVAQSMSKDHRHLAYITGGTDAALYTMNVGSKPVKLYTPKAATTTTGAEVLTGVTWSDDASHLLVSETVGGQPEELLFSAGGGAPVNLTSQYGFTFTGIQFSAGNWQQLYWIAPDGLRKLDIGNQTVSAVMAQNVTQFWVASNNDVLYAQTTPTGVTPAGSSLWSVNSSGHEQELIEALAPSSTYSVAYTSFLGTDEVAVVPSATGTGTLYSGVFGSTPTATTIAHGVSGASFSPDGHLLAFTAPSQIVVYDLNQSELQDKLVDYTSTNLPGQLESYSWFDNYHLLENRSGNLYWTDYDGTNAINLGSLYGGFPPYATSNTKGIIGFSTDSAGVRIIQLEIVH